MTTTGKPRTAAQFLPLVLGDLVATPGIAAMLDDGRFEPRHMVDCIERHRVGDWGEMDAEDSALNDQACCVGGRVMSAFAIDPTKPLARDNKVWIITEHDRSRTTLLLPGEY